VAEHRLDGGNDLAGRLRAEVPAAGRQVVEIASACQDNPLAGNNLAAEHFIDIGVNVALILCRMFDGVVMRIGKQLLDLGLVSACSLLAAGLVQSGRRQAQLIAQARDRRAEIFNDRPVWILRRVLAAGLVG